MNKKVFYRPRKRWGLRFLFLVILAGAVFYLYPSPIAPAACVFEEDSGFTGSFAENRQLLDASKISVPSGQTSGVGPEDIAISDNGVLFAGLENGDILRIDPAGSSSIVANTGGRPLGLDFEADGSLIIADGIKGLLRLRMPDNRLETLSRASDSVLFGFADDVDVASDGRIYFSDASYAHGLEDLNLEFMTCKPHGRLLRYDPESGRTETLLNGLFFANGVAVATDDSFVLVNETPQYRVQRYWLKGPKEGTSETVLDNLPGFPDGISSDGEGGFWLALYAPRDKTLDRLQANVVLKKLIAKLPDFLTSTTKNYGLVVHLNSNLDIDAVFQDPAGEKVYGVTSIEQKGESLYIGNLERPVFHKFNLPNQL